MSFGCWVKTYWIRDHGDLCLEPYCSDFACRHTMLYPLDPRDLWGFSPTFEPTIYENNKLYGCKRETCCWYCKARRLLREMCLICQAWILCEAYLKSYGSGCTVLMYLLWLIEGKGIALYTDLGTKVKGLCGSPWERERRWKSMTTVS